ncbi:sensor histidine kinase [Nocardioides nitrophenolicus]|uniref:sensor histidine kinase n=1 Tax=Nocardioides nitrophenolicus TaxID=60489 RepID=UPI00195CB85E|nr:HAMP domain-containing sensor histidine kinase [Nocardioides nitrophenolicus]MBM7518318.1 signal transduction histidine kinase [Nocardioides nitrophenolicus]
MLHPYGVLLLEDPSRQSVAAAGHLCMVLSDLVLLASALVLSFDVSIGHSLVRARMATAATLVAVQDLPLVMMSLGDAAHGGHSYRLTAGHLVTVLVLLAVLSVGLRDQHPPRVNPMLGGLLLGLGVLGVRLGLILTDPSPFLSVDRWPDLLVLAAITAVTVLVTVSLLSSPLPRWAAVRLACGVFVLFAARVAATLTEATSPPPGVIAGIVLCDALFATTVIGLLLSSLREHSSLEASLVLRAAEAEATVQHDREVAHEMRAATAGIVAGVHLLTSDQVPPGPRRLALKHMVDAEAARLGRTCIDDGPDQVTEIAVDDVVEPLVIAQEALGHRVHWHPDGHRVLARHDALAEVLNVLLTNAHRHAHGRATTVVSQVTGECVEIRVSDQGPGVEPELEDRLFQWGARGVASTGQGIGLQRAHRLMLELGGSLHHERSAASRGGGATFVVTLPAARTAAGPVPRPHVSAAAPPAHVVPTTAVAG